MWDKVKKAINDDFLIAPLNHKMSGFGINNEPEYSLLVEKEYRSLPNTTGSIRCFIYENKVYYIDTSMNIYKENGNSWTLVGTVGTSLNLNYMSIMSDGNENVYLVSWSPSSNVLYKFNGTTFTAYRTMQYKVVCGSTNSASLGTSTKQSVFDFKNDILYYITSLPYGSGSVMYCVCKYNVTTRETTIGNTDEYNSFSLSSNYSYNMFLLADGTLLVKDSNTNSSGNFYIIDTNTMKRTLSTSHYSNLDKSSAQSIKDGVILSMSSPGQVTIYSTVSSSDYSNNSAGPSFGVRSEGSSGWSSSNNFSISANSIIVHSAGSGTDMATDMCTIKSVVVKLKIYLSKGTRVYCNTSNYDSLILMSENIEKTNYGFIVTDTGYVEVGSTKISDGVKYNTVSKIPISFPKSTQIYI